MSAWHREKSVIRPNLTAPCQALNERSAILNLRPFVGAGQVGQDAVKRGTYLPTCLALL